MEPQLFQTRPFELTINESLCEQASASDLDLANSNQRSKSAPPEAEVAPRVDLITGVDLVDCMMMIAAETSDADASSSCKSQTSQLNTPTIVDPFFDGNGTFIPETQQRPEPEELGQANSKLTGRRDSSFIVEEFDYQESESSNREVDVDLNQYFPGADSAFDPSEYSSFVDSTNSLFSDLNSSPAALEQANEVINNPEKPVVYLSEQQQVAEKENNSLNWPSNQSEQQIQNHSQDHINTYPEEKQQCANYYQQQQQQPLPVESNTNQSFASEGQVSEVKHMQMMNGDNCVATGTSGNTIHYKVREEQTFQAPQVDLNNNNTIHLYQNDQSYAQTTYDHSYGHQHYDSTGSYAPKYAYEQQPPPPQQQQSEGQLLEYASHGEPGYAGFATGSSYEHQGYYQAPPEHRDQTNNQYQQHQQQTDENGNYLAVDDEGKTYHLLGQTSGYPNANRDVYGAPAYQQAAYGQPTGMLQQDQQPQPTASESQYYDAYNSNQQRAYPAAESIPVVSKLYDPTVEISGLIAAGSSSRSRRNRQGDEEDLSENGDEEEEEDDEEDEEEEEDEDRSNDTRSTGQGRRAAGRNGAPTGQKSCRPETLQRLRAFLLKRMSSRREGAAKLANCVGGQTSLYCAPYPTSEPRPSGSNMQKPAAIFSSQYSNPNSTTTCKAPAGGELPVNSSSPRVIVATNPRSEGRPCMTIKTIPARRKSAQRQTVNVPAVKQGQSVSQSAAPIGQRRSSVLLMSTSSNGVYEREDAEQNSGEQPTSGVIYKAGHLENEMQLRSRRIIMATPRHSANRQLQGRHSLRSNSTCSTCSSSESTSSRAAGEESPPVSGGSNNATELEAEQQSSSGVQTRSSKRRRNHDLPLSSPLRSCITSSPANSCTSV